MLLYDLTAIHLGVFCLESFSYDNSDFFLLCGDDEEESIVKSLLSDAILVEYFYSDIQ